MNGPGSKKSWSMRDRGAAAVEMALVLPLLMLIICGIVDYGRMLNAQITLTQAAREGARAASFGQTTAQINTRVANASTALKTADRSTSGVTTCPNGTGEATVTVNYVFRMVTPFSMFAGMFGGTAAGTYNLSSKAVVTCSG